MPDSWDHMSGWAAVLPPSRPDLLDLTRIRQTAGYLDRSSAVAVLGSTPEFRDVLWELGFERVHIFEKNLAHLKRTSALRYYRSPEILVEGDWLDTLPQWHGRFALILSDLTAGNIDYKYRPTFYNAITDALEPGGFFVDKNLTNPDGLMTIDELTVKYRFAPLNLLTANYFSCDAIFCSELQEQAGLIDTTAIYQQLEDALPGPRFRSLLKAAHGITPEGCIWFYGRRWNELAPDYCRNLRIVSRFDLTPNQPYHGRAFQFLLQKPTEKDTYNES